MKQRAALVAYEQSNGRYDLHRSTDIGRDLELATQISSETPYGHGSRDYESKLVEEDPIEMNVGFQSVIDRLDFSRFGAIIVVSESFELTSYRAPWFGLGEHCDLVSDGDPFGRGALVEIPFADGEPMADEFFCARFEGTKTTLSRLVDERILTAEQARDQLRELAVEFAATGRQVRFATGQEPDAAESSLAELAATGRRFLGRE